MEGSHELDATCNYGETLPWPINGYRWVGGVQDRGSRHETYVRTYSIAFLLVVCRTLLRTAYLSFFSFFSPPPAAYLSLHGLRTWFLRGMSVLMRGKYCKDMRLDPRERGIGKSSIGYCSDLSIGFYCII